MMSNEAQRVRPLLSKYEVEIPDRQASRELQYDEEAMVLLTDGRPAAGDPDPPVPPGTKITFVGQETTDDD
ncbi:MAG: hypothetical protein LC803_20165 [Acidobacteria bacterium]|nr:hypothetical protein [Acidobacteriota bacterium]